MTRHRVVLSLAATTAALVVTAPAAGASPPETGTGTGTVAIRDLSIIRQADGNVIQQRSLSGTVSGGLTGVFDETVEGVVHSNGRVTFHGTLTFTGTLVGCGTGTVRLGVSGLGVTGAPVTESSVRTIDQADSSIPVRGTGTISQVGPSLTYEIRYVCG